MAVVIKKEMINQMNDNKVVNYIIIADVDGIVMQFSEGMGAATADPDAEIDRARAKCVNDAALVSAG